MDINEALSIIPRSLVSLITLFIATKILGKKQISELSLFDYAIGISIGNFAAEMTVNLEQNYLYGIIAVISAIIPLAIFIMIPESIVRLLLVIFSSVLISCIVIYSIGLDKSEKHFVQEKVFSKVKLKNRK